MSEKGGTVKELKDIFLQEQVLDNMPAELVTYVKDREPQSIDDVIKFWIRYDEARTSERRKKRTPDAKGSGDKGSGDKGRNDGDKSRGLGGKGDSRPKVSCFFCKGPHFRINCPKLKRKEEASAAMQEEEENPNENRYDKLCGECVKKNFTKYSQILVEGKPTTAYRDTGSTSIIVNANLVPEEKISSQVKETTLAKKTLKEPLRTAKIHLDTPYFVGETEVSVM